jgi:hypothetical protein
MVFHILVKSPVLGHLVTSIRGLTTIRALNAQKSLQQEFDHHQDVHTSAYYLLQATMFTFTFRIDVICVVFTVVIIFSYLLFETRKIVKCSRNVEILNFLFRNYCIGSGFSTHAIARFDRKRSDRNENLELPQRTNNVSRKSS